MSQGQIVDILKKFWGCWVTTPVLKKLVDTQSSAVQNNLNRMEKYNEVEKIDVVTINQKNHISRCYAWKLTNNKKHIHQLEANRKTLR